MKRLRRFFKGKPLRWYLVLLLIAGAGPFAADVAILIDLFAVLGADIFMLSVLVYFREALLGWVRPCLSRLRALVERNGLLWPDRAWLESPDELGRRLVYNFDIMDAPLRGPLCALIAAAVAASLACA